MLSLTYIHTDRGIDHQDTLALLEHALKNTFNKNSVPYDWKSLAKPLVHQIGCGSKQLLERNNKLKKLKQKERNLQFQESEDSC